MLARMLLKMVRHRARASRIGVRAGSEDGEGEEGEKRVRWVWV